MLSLYLLALSLVLAKITVALPQPKASAAPSLARRDDESDFTSLEDSTATSTIPLASDAAVTTTVSPSGQPGQPTDVANQVDVSGLGEPIEGTSFFYISQDCFSDTRNMGSNGFANRGQFYQQAYKDAIILADQATKWPTYGTDASDLYFGKDTENSQYVDNIKGDFAAAADWDHPRFGFDNYIILDCSDSFGSCKNRVDNDPRPIACYVNNTISWWWNKSYINCCEPFFNLDTINQRYNENNGKPTAGDLRYLQTSGSFLLHEMMHTLEITGTSGQRPHIVDKRFDAQDGATVRIYGPKFVAKAAAMYGPRVSSLNADSFAQFASAIYWKDRFGNLPLPSSNVVAPANYTELITDNDLNYIEEMVPVVTSSVSGPNPSSCVYTVTSEAGLTSTGYYTLQPTVATMCICDSTVMAGINTVTGTSSTSYLVCAVPSHITISTMGPTVASSTITATTATPPPVNTSSAAYEACENDLGASSCGENDLTCLRNQCTADSNCQSSGYDCSTVG